ncbi:MAG: hypothetical protein I8H86_06260 [Sphingomonadaceae bacterium]|nr:hypothetical protein [Sphingomonadaceae bacterium]
MMAAETIARLSAALIQCRDQFAFYAAEHAAAGKTIKAATNQRFVDIASNALADVEPKVSNPSFWFYSAEEDAEWWHRGGGGRDEAIAAARASYPGQAVWVTEARRMSPHLSEVVLADNVIDRIQDDECWGEDGWEGYGDEPELQRRLDATIQLWFAECCDLHGAQLDFVNPPEEVAAS